MCGPQSGHFCGHNVQINLLVAKYEWECKIRTEDSEESELIFVIGTGFVGGVFSAWNIKVRSNGANNDQVLYFVRELLNKMTVIEYTQYRL